MYMQHTLTSAIAGLAVSPWVSAGSAREKSACTAAAIPHPNVFGAEILNISASEHHNQTILSDDPAFPTNLTVSYCGVNVSYTHPGWNDVVNINIWLPLDNWNGRFQGLGGGGFRMGAAPYGLVIAVNDGYSAATTDGGHAGLTADDTAPSNWALLSPGNLNMPLLFDFASVALSDLAIIGKAVTESYYGKKPDYSYWTGCSTGGRQGLMLAQRYPDLYDGVLALAPAINWDTFLVTEYWPQQVMNQLGVYPPPCELEAFTKAAIAACDGLDGLEDGVISDANACTFDPHSVVGQEFTCEDNGTQVFTPEGAKVAEVAWSGLVDPSGKRQWYGLNKDAELSGLAGTVAATKNTSAKGVPFDTSVDWIKWFVAKDPSFEITNMTNEEYFRILHQSRNQFASIMGTSDPDLSHFQSLGKKMITWHGLADTVIFPNGTEDYYKRVSEEIPDVHDFYRIFEAPGIGHCSGGVGAQPVGELEALVDWVEKGVAPEILYAVNTTLSGEEQGPDRVKPSRKICAWPKVQKYNGGDPAVAESFDCE
ncbi:hypothetical protein Q7P37_003675 [Cladosporium fusiforme]